MGKTVCTYLEEAEERLLCRARIQADAEKVMHLRSVLS